jgi:hypothetical protein
MGVLRRRNDRKWWIASSALTAGRVLVPELPDIECVRRSSYASETDRAMRADTMVFMAATPGDADSTTLSVIDEQDDGLLS